ncbi:MAG: hypothetical protein OEW84_03250 [Aigarchaeota archaeon]|nr:hypothetical protein [Aigarchaeota archaeon]
MLISAQLAGVVAREMVKVKDLEEVRVKVAATLKGEEGIVGDALRVLAIHHGVAWRSELLVDLAKFCRFQLRQDLIAPRSVDSAVRRLKELDLLTVEERRRGSVTDSRTYSETLIRLRDTEAVRTALLSDPAFARYWYHRQQTIQDRLSRELGEEKS